MHLRHGALLILSLAAVTACGTTVPTSQLAGAGAGGAGDGLAGATQSAPQTAGSAGSSGGGGSLPGTAGVAGSGAAGTSAGGATIPQSTSGGSNVGGPAGTALASRKAGTVKVGFETIKGGNAAISAAFGTPVNFGDGQAEVTAIVNDVNAHGGVGGRQIVPFFAAWDVTSKDPGREATCKALTEDDHVQFIITVINMSQTFASCAAQHGVPVINASFGSGDTTLYKSVGKYLYSPSLMSLNREESLVLNTLKASGRANTKDELGVIIDNTGDPIAQRVYDATINPLLTSWGVPHESYSVAQESDISGAVLRFHTDNVKTVVFAAPSGVIEVLFMTAADNQQYRPQYGLGDSTDPWFIASAAPAAQVQNITGAGSLPISNVQVAQYPTTPREKVCLDLIAKQGETNADRHSSITATVYCEAIREFAFVGSLVSGPLNADSFAQAYPTAGRSYPPVTTFSIDFGNGRHDNAAQYRLFAYTSACTCVNYTSGLIPLPSA